MHCLREVDTTCINENMNVECVKTNKIVYAGVCCERFVLLQT